jgi:hypothetical protein
MIDRSTMRVPFAALVVFVAAAAPAAAQTPQNSAVLDAACSAVAAGKAMSVVGNHVTIAVGEAGTARARIRFAKERGSREALVIATCAAGGAGSKLAISAGGAAAPVLSHTFTAEQCSQKGGADACLVVIPRDTPAAQQLTRAFFRSNSGRVRIETQGGAMMLDKDVALDGFSRMMRDKGR